ncbi:pPIWI_RE_Y domain-containing protein [Streptomyces rubiginosohelvolus]|uniref:pPIWI_RE_Y domain-containing protein n=1 Tax=Streptomyces rubiginosohelvolus TaxID=67362 RepID=UPI00382C5AA2
MTAGTAARRTGRTATGEAPQGLGTELFLELARTVASLAEVQGLRSFALPYPGLAQRALDRTVLHCLEVGETPPQSLPELWEWCRTRPADDPLFAVPAALLTPGTTLVHPVGRMPTRSCLEIASHGPGGGVAAHARALLDDLEARCGTGDRFRQSRRFMARHPVVHQQDRFGPGWSKAVWSRVKDLYGPIPESLLTDGVFLRCPTCGLPALPGERDRPVPGPQATDDDLWCEGEVCPRDEAPELIRDPEQAWILRSPLRMFLALPHRTEEAAREALDRAGIGHAALPGPLCAFRLTDTGPDLLDIQVHDRLQPALLAARLADSAAPADRTLVVVPEALVGRDGYRETFINALPAFLRDRLVLTTPADLVPDLGRVRGEKENDA